LPFGHADRAKQTEFADPFEYRQRQRVDDADEGDDHGECEQQVEEDEYLVDLVGLVGLVLGLVLDLDVGEVRDDPVDRRARRVRRHVAWP
jgi:hypothetical protein